MRPLCALKAVLLLLAAALAGPAAAHESRPALLQITERADGRLDVVWKQPASGDFLVPIRPDISGGLLTPPPTRVSVDPSVRTAAWVGIDPGEAGLDGRTVSVHGLDRTIMDVLVLVSRRSGADMHRILRPGQPSLRLDAAGRGAAVGAYFRLGVEHIFGGVDHLLFLLGLLLLVRGGLAVVQTVTAFTAAHSATLAATALGAVAPSPPLIEFLVAASIVFVAVEVVRMDRGERGMMQRLPWAAALMFGLLHGSAFAGALAEIGLPRDAIPMSLLLFNLGIEAGQLVIVAAALALWRGVSRLGVPFLPLARRAVPYGIAAFACFWSAERLHVIVG